jgi:hypothetical protein
MLTDLTVEGGAYADQITALADEQLQDGPGLVAVGFLQSAAGDGGAVDGGQIGVIGFVAGIDTLAVLLGDKGMENTGLEAGAGEGTLDEAVIATSAFDGDEAVVELVLGKGLANLSDGVGEGEPVVLDVGRWDEHPAVEIGEEKLGTHLGAVEAEDAEMIGADSLHARVELPARLGDMEVETTGARKGTRTVFK